MDAEKQQFKGVENYFTYSIHYLDGEPFKVPLVDELDSGNEADTESEYEQGLIFNDIEPVVVGLENLYVNNPVYEDSEVIFNNNDDLAYLSCVEFNSDMSDTSDSILANPLPWLYAELSLSMPIRSSFVVSATVNGQKDIIFGKSDGPSQNLLEESEKEEKDT